MGLHILIIAYCQMLGETKCDSVNRFWNALGSRFSSLSVVAVRRLMAPLNSIDA
uniref:Uncharacterized protein n=1 Tax=Anguilla anguilla TaxID=7936 RepID=A0A0E9SBK8_ANGAN